MARKKYNCPVYGKELGDMQVDNSPQKVNGISCPNCKSNNIEFIHGDGKIIVIFIDKNGNRHETVC